MVQKSREVAAFTVSRASQPGMGYPSRMKFALLTVTYAGRRRAVGLYLTSILAGTISVG
jgi:hypothetical protein